MSSRERKKCLSSFCETRCVANHESLITFKSLLPAIVEALDEMILSWTDDSTSKALAYLTSIRTPTF
jgi:hypothetical protein